MIKKLFALLFCAALLGASAGCSDDKDEGEGVLTDPSALVGKWQVIQELEHYQRNGEWHDVVDYDVDNLNGGDLFFEIFESNGVYRYENYDLNGTMWKSGSNTWRYENEIIHIDRYAYTVIVLTPSKLVYRDYDDEEYEEITLVRIE